MVRGRPLPRVVGHSQRPHDALGRDRWLGLGVPPAGDEQQRPHRRPAGPAGVLRASRPLRVAHRVRRHAHRARRSLSRASASIRPTTWWSRATAASGSPTRATASTPTTKATLRRARSAPATSIASTRRAAASASSRRTSCSPTASRSRPTSRCCTSPTPALTHRADGPHHVRRFTRRGRRPLDFGRRGVRHLPGRAVRRLSRRRARQPVAVAGDGVHCHAPDGALLGRIRFRRRSPTCASAARSSTACSSAPRRRCIRCS